MGQFYNVGVRACFGLGILTRWFDFAEPSDTFLRVHSTFSGGLFHVACRSKGGYAANRIAVDAGRSRS
jgi:hypothetical protein